MDRKNILRSGSVTGSKSFLSASNRSLNASRPNVVFESSQHVLEQYGTSLPVAVIEMQHRLVERKVECSGCLSTAGWAWFVCGRQLVVWNYSLSSVNPQKRGKASVTPRSFELTLPPSDLAHKADLVAVFTADQNTIPSCIAVSPEGLVRCWPSVAHENSFVEMNADLHGQECDTLKEVMPFGCLLATTTASVLLLTPQVNEAKPTIVCRSFRTPQGLLGSLGRRVSSLIFGAIPAHSTEAKLVKLLAQKRDAATVDVQVICSQTMQYWQVGDIERLIFELDLDKMARESFITHIWSRDMMHINLLKISILDSRIEAGNLQLLISASNPNCGDQIQYALATVSLESKNPPSSFASFIVLSLSACLNDSEELTNYRFLSAGNVAYLYNDAGILCFPTDEALEEPDRIELRSRDRLLGGVVSEGRPLFFSARLGVLLLNPSTDGNQSLIDETIIDRSFSAAESGGTLTTPVPESVTSKLKLAFIQYCRKNLSEARSLLDEFFVTQGQKGEVDSSLDRAVVSLSQDIIDDYPGTDPRWKDSVPAGHESTGASVSLLILRQLEDKNKAQDIYFNFLRHMAVWSELTAVTDKRGTKPTAQVLCEHAEKLKSAIALRTLHTPSQSLVEAAIKRVLLERKDQKRSSVLTPQDLFYREVSAIGAFFAAYVDVVAESATNKNNPQEKTAEISNAASVVSAMLTASRDYRAKHSDWFEQFELLGTGSSEVVPWTAVPGPRSVRSSIIRMIHLIIEEAVPYAVDAGTKSGLWNLAADLADVILEALKTQLDSVLIANQFAQAKQDVQRERNDIFDLFLKGSQWDKAGVLAEKYGDFRTLLLLCDKLGNDKKLDEYMDKFGDQGFTEFVCNWHLQNNQRHKLLKIRRPEVSVFLQNHPNLLWVDQSEKNRFLEAGMTLSALANCEKDKFQRKKTLLSLSKLHLIAAQLNDQEAEVAESELQAANAELVLLTHQQQLPANVLESVGMDHDNMRVLGPREIIEMYISQENYMAGELDFKKALDLLAYIGDSEERDYLRARVWAVSILRDAWTTLDTDAPLDAVTNTLFFRIINLALSQGEDLGELLPQPEDLLKHPELCELAENSVFTYLLNVAYEHVRALMSD